MAEPRYASTTMLIGKRVSHYKGEEFEYVNSLSARNHCDVNLEVGLEDGEYIICSMLSGKYSKEEATLSCYCEHAVQMTQSPPLNEE